MSKKLKNLLIRIIISFFIFLCAILLPISDNIKLIIYLISYFTIGFDIIRKAFKNIGHGQIFDENFLMTIATFGAFIIKEYPEGVMVMWLYQIGEWFQQYAVGKSRKSITELMNIRPDYANVERDGKIEEVNPDDVEINELIIVKPGEKIPLDGIIVEGNGLIDTSALTGESALKSVSISNEVFSGCISKNGLLKIKVSKKYEESTVSKILELVENASTKKTKAENFITRFAKYYTPIVVIAALALAFLPPIFINDANIWDYIHRACSFLVTSCPCALVISVPLSFFGGIGGASKSGILIKGSNYLENLSKVQIVVFDKTGTLTKGTFEVTKINSDTISDEKLLEIAAYAENYSNHPIAISIKKAYNKKIDNTHLSEVHEIPGNGIYAKIDGKSVYVGNEKLMKSLNISIPDAEIIGTKIYIARDNKYLGYIIISDKIKEEAKQAIMDLKEMNNIKQTIMLTGDSKDVAENVANNLQIDNVYAELLPADKVQKVEELIKNKSKNCSLAFVGDGINDAPVLTRADIGIAMGGLGSDAAIEAADVVIMDDNILKINTAIKISKYTLSIVKQNIIFALLIKFIVLILAGFGIASMWEAVFADVGVTFIAILNSMRTLKIK